MEIQSIIISYLAGEPFSDVKAETQVRFNVLNLKLLTVNNFISQIKKNAIEAFNTVELISLLENVWSAVNEEFNALPPLPILVKNIDPSTVDKLAEKNKGTD